MAEEKPVRVHDVFKTQGSPTVTYVRREDGQFEQRLADALDSKGLLCLLTGPSKTGKTTLYTKVAQERNLELIRVRCSVGLSADDIWKKALENVNFERVAQTQAAQQLGSKGGGKVGGSFGWKWLAGVSGEVSTEVSAADTDTEIRQKILAEPAPEHLVPILQNLPYLLVIEDFHYLSEQAQRQVFQQWKVFVDNEVSALVVGTTHHAAKIANSNRDLVGRTSQIDLTTWDVRDLRRIAVRGLRYMNVVVPDLVTYEIAKESVGLPIVTQSVCQQLLIDHGVREPSGTSTRLELTAKDVYQILNRVAKNRYDGFSNHYEKLTRGPRQKARKYDTYELILSTFALDPPVFSLSREEILERLQGLPIRPSDIPPIGSITSTVRALRGFQEKMGIELLEWSETDGRLHILEPTFLFFLRWRKPRQTSPSIIDLFGDLFTFHVDPG